MLRFAFKPRHPVTRVAFTADGSEVVTAQPHTSVAVRDRLTGEARVSYPLLESGVIHELILQPYWEWIVVRTDRGGYIFDLNPLYSHVPRHFVQLPEFRTAVRREGVQFWRVTNSRCPDFDTKEREQVRVSDEERIAWISGIRQFSPASRFAVLVRERLLPLLWSPQQLQPIVRLRSSISALRLRRSEPTLTFSSDETKLAITDGEELNVFDLTDLIPFDGNVTEKSLSSLRVLDPLFTLERPDPTQHGTFADKQAEHWLPPVAFDHAGRSMFTLGLRNRVQRIDLATGGVMAEWGWRCEPIRSLAVSPDDLTAAAGCQRGELVLWDLE